MKIFNIILLALFTLTSIQGQSIIGKIGKANGSVVLNTNNESLVVELPENLKYTMDDVYLGWDQYFFQVNGEIKNGVLKTDRTPRITAGDAHLDGVLTQGDQGYEIDGQKVIFGKTKSIYNNKFDQISEQSFVNTDVRTYGVYQVVNGERVYVINSIIPKGLFSAAPVEMKFLPHQSFIERGEHSAQYYRTVGGKNKAFEYVINEVPKNIISQSQKAFRGTVVKGNDKEPEAGDPVLIISLSGRQGDAADTVGGHFAIGMGELDEELEIRGEIFNFYFEGPKEVPAGNTEISSYFGHLIQGQNNYRPTYTAIVYGKSKEELLSVRNAFEKDLHKVRTVEGLGITPMYNCSTASFKAMAPIGIKGAHEYKKMSKISEKVVPKPKLDAGYAKQLAYGALVNRATYIPRKTFESLLENIVKRTEETGVSRMDYIFYPQTKSNRPVGGISVNGLVETLKFYGISKIRAKQIRKYLEALEVLEKENPGKIEKWRAERTIKRFISDEECQRILTNIMGRHFKNG